MNCDDKILAWHFVGETLRDGREIPADGAILTHVGPVIPCQRGLHASERLIDALQYAPGHTLCRVECWGDIEHDADDKLAARNRRILWRIDAEQVLRAFARRCALDVIHLWDAPDVVREYLETGNEALRDAARAAAGAAARAAAGAAAGAAARATARAAAWDAACAAARAAAWDAARAAACAAACAAAGYAAVAAAVAAAWAAARPAQNSILIEMVEAEYKRIIGELSWPPSYAASRPGGATAEPATGGGGGDE